MSPPKKQPIGIWLVGGQKYSLHDQTTVRAGFRLPYIKERPSRAVQPLHFTKFSSCPKPRKYSPANRLPRHCYAE